jgi:hypothetical protein
MLRYVAAALMLTFATGALAEWSEKDVAKLVEKMKKGEGIAEGGSVPSQVFGFTVGNSLLYTVDLKMQICLVSGRTGESFTPVSCAALKKAYPLFAPLITW